MDKLSSAIAASIERLRALRQSLSPASELTDALETHVEALRGRVAELEEALPLAAMGKPSAPVAASVERVRTLGKTVELTSELTSALKTQSSSLERQCHRLEEALPSLAAMADRQLESTDTSSASDDGQSSEGTPEMADPARLAALAMAMQGHGRQEVEDYLRSLAVPNIERILVSVFSDGEGG